MAVSLQIWALSALSTLLFRFPSCGNKLSRRHTPVPSCHPCKLIWQKSIQRSRYPCCQLRGKTTMTPLFHLCTRPLLWDNRHCPILLWDLMQILRGIIFLWGYTLFFRKTWLIHLLDRAKRCPHGIMLILASCGAFILVIGFNGWDECYIHSNLLQIWRLDLDELRLPVS